MAANIGQSVANSFLMVANLFSTLKITKLSVPELVQTNSSVTLDCEYSALDDQVTLQWLFNQRPVYLWRPGQAPMVSGVLEGRIDDGYKVADEPKYEYRALRLVTLEPELSGDYTCVIQKNGSEDRQTKSMLVFSPEHEFVLAVSHNDEDLIEINCIARGIYPQPNMVLERNRDLIAKQDQRVWRNESLYDSGCQARVTRTELRERDRITCRLELPQAGYSAMREKQIHLGDLNQCHIKNNSTKTNRTCANGASIPRRIQINFYIILVLITSINTYDCALM